MGARVAAAVVLIFSSRIGAAQVAAEFYLEKANYAIGEPIFVYFQAVNEGTRPLRLYSADPNSDCSAFHITISNDRPAPSCTRAINCGSSTIVLQPNEKHVERILLNLAHNVSSAGEYSVKAEVATAFAYGSKITLKPAALHFQVDQHLAQPEVFQPLLDQLRSSNPIERVEGARALASAAPLSLQDTLLKFADNLEFRKFAPLAFHRLNTQRSMKALKDLLDRPDLDTFEFFQTRGYLAHDECADAPWMNLDITHTGR
jgi:hypothetical protein